MDATYFSLADDDEAELDADAQEILGALRQQCCESGARLASHQTSALLEERHLRLRLARDADDWVELLVGDGYTEFAASGEKTYRGYLTPADTVVDLPRFDGVRLLLS